jgi:hypothetical protein
LLPQEDKELLQADTEASETGEALLLRSSASGIGSALLSTLLLWSTLSGAGSSLSTLSHDEKLWKGLALNSLWH